MQEYGNFEDTEYISDAPTKLNKNMQSIITDFSGTSFPTANLFVGMKCLRTDENKVYRLYENASNQLVWQLEYTIIDGGIKVKQAVNDANGKPLNSYIADIKQSQSDESVLDVFDGDGNKVASIKTTPDIDLQTVNSIVVEALTEFARGGSEKISDVETWEQTSTPITNRERAACYGDGYYVVVGTSGDIVISTDARDWNKLPAFTNAVITGICYGKGRFVAVDSDSEIYTTLDIMSNQWKKTKTDIDAILEAITYANGRFVATFDGGYIALSDDGYTWETVDTGIGKDLYAITAGQGKFMAVGLSGSVVTSIDGKVWVDCTDVENNTQWRAVGYGAGKFVVGGQGGVVRYSEDGGNTWKTGTTDSTSSVNYIRAIQYLEGKYYAAMYVSTGKGEVWVSDDGANWEVQYVSSGRLWCLGKSDTILFASGDNGHIHIIDLNIDWTTEQIEGADIWTRTVIVLNDATRIVTDGVKAGGAVTSVNGQTGDVIVSDFNSSGHLAFPDGSEFWIA